MIIISGYQGVGKTTFTRETHLEDFGKIIKSFDLESSNYDKSNKKWHVKYVDDIIDIMRGSDFDVLFIASHQAIRDLLNDLQIHFYFVIPDVTHKHEWTEALAERVLKTVEAVEREKNIRALIGHILMYDKIIEELMVSHKPLFEKRKFEHIETVSDVSNLKYFIFRTLDRTDKGA